MTTVVVQDEQPISRTYQYRKVMKPMLERKRRARINHCLDELKELLVGALQAEGESVSRLEKADVLELTVRHLHKLRRLQQFNENSASERFKAGFITCTNEVSKYMSNIGSSLDLSVSARLLSHLDHCIHQIEAQTVANAAANGMMIPNGPLSSSSSSSTIILQNPMQQSQISPLHHHLASATGVGGVVSHSPVSASTMSLNSANSGYNSLSSSSGSASPAGMPNLHAHSHSHTRTSPNPNLNVLTTYTPPTSPASASSPIHASKLMYHHHPHPYAAALAAHKSMSNSKPPSPAHAHANNQNSHIFSLTTSANQEQLQQSMPLSLCTKPERRMDRNNNNDEEMGEEEPFDLSNSMWRPW